MTYRVRNIGIAVALAVVAALLTSFYVTNYKRHVQRGEDHVTVLVAKRDIPVGTAGSDVVGELSATEVPRRSVVPGAISSPDEVKNKVASQAVFAGEQVTTSRFSSVSEAGLAGQFKGTMRAVQVAGDQNQVLAGTLNKGDHVDIVATVKVPPDTLYSRVLIRDLKVLVAPGTPAAASKLTSGTDQTFSLMLRMTDNQAQKFEYVIANREGATQGAGWRLALRPVVSPADSGDHVDNAYTVLSDGLNARQRRVLGR
jgi:Flp pilus assembly protein CpaB